MPKKPRDQEATKKSASQKSGTDAPKTNAHRTQKTEDNTGTKKTGPAPSAGNISPDKPRKPAAGTTAASQPQRATGSDKSTVQTEPRSQGLKKWGEKARTGPDSVDFPIVAIGASAGGLEAFEQFFTNMPSDAGIAFVIVQHLDPKHKSILAELIGRYTKMEVFQVKDGMAVRPNCVHVIPPDSYLAILNGKLQLLEPTEVPGMRTPIDYFFRSLAADQREMSICIVMSGTGSEGALGLRAVKGEGGMGMVQDPDTARYDGMPRNAIATGMADFVLPADRLPAQLIEYVDHKRIHGDQPTKVPAGGPDFLDKIFVLVRQHTGHDFSLYKRNTILRRIERRMALNKVPGMRDYVRFVQKHPEEAEKLFLDLLIGVTSFFRDPDAFEVLKERAMEKIISTGAKDRPVRIWIPGCATGEEAYSIVMIAQECMEKLKINRELQVFGTDINPEAIDSARAGVYPRSIAGDVSAKRLRRFFSEEGDIFRVKKEIREKVVFAVQNVLSDPPFSKLDLVSCRNLLIYLTVELQKKVIPLFHYAIRPGGFLFLGSAESLGEFGELFSAVDRKWKLFKRKETVLAAIEYAEIPPLHHLDKPRAENASRAPRNTARVGYREAMERRLLNAYSPAAVVITEGGEIVYVHGRTGKYLELAPGLAPYNVVAMAREGLRLDLTSAIRTATRLNQEVRVENIRVKTNGAEQAMNLIVEPCREPSALQGLYLVIFEDLHMERPPNPSSNETSLPKNAGQRVTVLEKELQNTKEHLQSTIEELETSNEELKSSNEELQSSNEELQSSNEELETSKEELQSVNEELATVNVELQQKMEDLSRANSDMSNLLTSTQIATIFLDAELNVRRFTPPVTEFIPLIQSDIGRPVKHVASNLKYDGLVEDAQRVLRTLVPVEKEIQAQNDTWYLMRILPYRTIKNVIDGIVMTFIDISVQKKALEEAKLASGREEAAELNREFAESIVDTVRHPLLVLDDHLRVRFANHTFYESFETNRDRTEGRLLYELGEGEWNIPELRNLLEKILPDKMTVESFRMEHQFRSGRKVMLLNARKIKQDLSLDARILLAIEEVKKGG